MAMWENKIIVLLKSKETIRGNQAFFKDTAVTYMVLFILKLF